MKRREFFRRTLPAVVLPTVLNGFSIKAFANSPLLQQLAATQTNTDHVLVIIYLAGGNDGLNTVIPLDQYTQLNPARANVLLNSSSVLPLNGTTTTGLHPALTGLRDLYNEGKLTIVQSVGYPSQSYSHFRSTDIWVSGADANQVLNSGWVGRYLDNEYPGYPNGYPSTAVPDPLAIQIGTNVPLLFQGAEANMVFTVSDVSIFSNWSSGINDPAPTTPAGDELTYVRLIAQQTDAYAQSVVNAFAVPVTQYNYPTGNYLGDALKGIAHLIKGGLQTRIYMVGLGSFDTHSDQVVAGALTTGTHASLLTMLSDAIYAFQQDLELLGIDDRVVGMTFSEFGRRIKSNNSLGTDHGAAAPLFVFGSNVQGGIIGTNPTIPGTVTDEDNLPMQYDFRSVYGSILHDWFCVPQTDVNNILLQNYQTLPIINSNCNGVSIQDVIKQEELISVSNSPNPFVSSTKITFQTTGGHTMVQVFDALGRIVKTLANGNFAPGKHEVSFENEGFPAGNYYCRLQNGALQKGCVMVIVR